MKLIAYFVSFPLFLSACAVTHETYGPNGEKSLSINCSGSALTWNACYEKAGDACGDKGYSVVSQVGEGAGTAVATSSGFFASNSHARTLLVSCKR